MATPNEICLVLGIIVSGLFYMKVKRLQIQSKNEELLDNFLQNKSRF